MKKKQKKTTLMQNRPAKGKKKEVQVNRGGELKTVPVSWREALLPVTPPVPAAVQRQSTAYNLRKNPKKRKETQFFKLLEFSYSDTEEFAETLTVPLAERVTETETFIESERIENTSTIETSKSSTITNITTEVSREISEEEIVPETVELNTECETSTEVTRKGNKNGNWNVKSGGHHGPIISNNVRKSSKTEERERKEKEERKKKKGKRNKKNRDGNKKNKGKEKRN